jgi:hypothetical protein
MVQFFRQVILVRSRIIEMIMPPAVFDKIIAGANPMAMDFSTTTHIISNVMLSGVLSWISFEIIFPVAYS